MSLLKTAADDLEAVLATVDGVRLTQLGGRYDPPAVVVGMPSVKFDAYCNQPTSARFPVYVLVEFSDRARDELWQLVEVVSDALEESTDATVVDANPAPFNANGTELPSYEFMVEVAL